MKKCYLIQVVADLPYPKTFTYRVTANNAGRAADFAIRLLKKEPAARKKRESGMHIRIPLIDPLAAVEEHHEEEPVAVMIANPEKEHSQFAKLFAQ